MTRPNITKSSWSYDKRTGEIYAGKDTSRYCVGFVAQPKLGQHATNGIAISALPDLLEALEGLTSFAETYHNTTDASGYIDAAKSALIKAGYTF